MARLEIEIGGDSSGLEGAGTRALGILEKLQLTADKLNIKLFQATDVKTLQNVGEKLTTVNGYLQTYTDLALKSNNAFQDQQATAALDTLGAKLRALTGHAELFGTSLRNQQAQVRAYESALTKMLSTGLDPTDARVVTLKKNIDDLNASISRAKPLNLQSTVETAVFSDLQAKLQSLNGQASLFGNTLQNQQSQIRAYESAISRLLTAGLAPTDAKIVKLKANLEALNTSLSKTRSAEVETTTFDTLSSKLTTLKSQAELFGNTLQNQQAQLKAYEAAMASLLSAGLAPTDAKVVSLKANIDRLTASMANTKAINIKAGVETAAFDALGAKLQTLKGQAELFGNTLQNQQAQVKAYEAAISKLLSAGLEPTDSRIVSLKKNIEDLNSTMNQARQSNLQKEFKATGQLIPDLENKIKRLRTALTTAADERSIVKYNVRLRQAQDELARLRNLGLSAAKSNETLGAALRSSSRDANGAARGYNAVSLEFGRIIQDAPFAANNFGAIGNNITRLFEVLPEYNRKVKDTIRAQGGLVTSGNVLKQSLFGLVTGWGGLTLAISVAASAYTFYQQYVQKTAREQDKLTESTTDYIDTLRGVAKAQLQGTQAAQDELTNLRSLFGVYQDANVNMQQRLDAYAQLQQMFPEYFGNIEFEEKATLQTTEAYEKLTKNILASARARAAANLITENSQKQLQQEMQLLDTASKLRELAERERAGLERINRAAGPDNIEGVAARESALRNKIEEERQAILAKNNELANEHVKLTEDNEKLQKNVNDLLADGASLIDLKNQKTGRTAKTPKEIKEETLYESPNSVALAGLEGVELELQKVRQKYLKFYNDLSEAAKKSGADINKINQLMLQAEADERVEASAIILAEEQRIAAEIERIRTESGVKIALNKKKEILSVLKWYDEEIAKAKGNADILVAIEEGKHARINAINEKYLRERLDKHEKLYDKIQELEDKPFRINELNTRQASRALEEDLRKRLNMVRDYYDELRKLHAGNVWMQASLFADQANTENTLRDNKQTADAGELGEELSRAVRKFGRDFYDTITSINEMADRSFEAIFTKVFDGLAESMDHIFLNVFQKQLTTAFEKAAEDLESELTGAIAAVGLLGGVIAGSTKKTSVAGQMVGQGLQGAATGAMIGTAIAPGIGTAIGAGLGAAIGATSGLISAKKAQKQERLQEEQLREAQKQTKLLERQNALAYTSSIIGRMTTEGVVTSVEINEFGQLTTKISGQDLLVVLDRANSSRLRGT